MTAIRLSLLGAALVAAAASSHATTTTPAAVFFGPTPYLQAADIPAGFYASGGPTLLETLEDGILDASLLGQGGSVLRGYGPAGVDSVDADDGVLDNNCFKTSPELCGSWFNGAGNNGARFSYQGAGPLPTAFGVVWTDGAGSITFSAVGAGGVALGSFTASGFPDAGFGGASAEDRFFGVQFAGGIQSIHISNSAGGIEVDHIQYGSMAAAVPEPGSTALLLAGGGVIAWRLRRLRRQRVA